MQKNITGNLQGLEHLYPTMEKLTPISSHQELEPNNHTMERVPALQRENTTTTTTTWSLVNSTKWMKSIHFNVHIYVLIFGIFLNDKPMTPIKNFVCYFTYIDYCMTNVHHIF